MASTVNMTMNATARKVLKASSVGPMPPARRSPDGRGQYVPDCSACRLLVNLNAFRHRSLVRGNHGKANMQRGSLVVLLAAEIGGQGAGRALEPVVREIPGVVAGGSGGGIARVPSLAARRPGAAGFRDRCRRDRGGRHRVRARSRHVDQCRRLRRTGYIIAAVIVVPPRSGRRPRLVRWRRGTGPRTRPGDRHDHAVVGVGRLGPPGPGSGALWPTMTVLALDGLLPDRAWHHSVGADHEVRAAALAHSALLTALTASPAGVSARPSEATTEGRGISAPCRVP